MRQDIITPENIKILEVKYSTSPRIADIDLTLLDQHVRVSLLRTHVITGWTLPLEEIMDVLIDEYRNLLLQDYEDVNFEEIIFAFRKYGIRIEDWGKDMNLNLITKVLDAYMEDRYDIGLLEERVKMSDAPQLLDFAPKVYTDEEILEIAKEYWDHSPSPRIEFINPNCYEILVKHGKIVITEDDKNRIRKHADLLMEGYFTNVTELRKMRLDEKYKSMLCKKIAVSEFFNVGK